MTISQLIGRFDDEAYTRKISNLSKPACTAKHREMEMKCEAIVTTIGATLLASAPLHGIPLVTLVIPIRRLTYTIQKWIIIRDRMIEECWPVPRLSRKDHFLATLPAIVAHHIPGIDHLFADFAGHAAGEGAKAFVEHHAGDLVSAAIHDPGTVVDGRIAGSHDQMHAITGALHGHHADLVSTSSIGTSPFELGHVAGQAGTRLVEDKLVEELVKPINKQKNEIVEDAVRRTANRIIYPKTTRGYCVTRSTEEYSVNAVGQKIVKAHVDVSIAKGNGHKTQTLKTKAVQTSVTERHSVVFWFSLICLSVILYRNPSLFFGILKVPLLLITSVVKSAWFLLRSGLGYLLTFAWLLVTTISKVSFTGVSHLLSFVWLLGTSLLSACWTALGYLASFVLTLFTSLVLVTLKLVGMALKVMLFPFATIYNLPSL
jgi:hypothetical protein